MQNSSCCPKTRPQPPPPVRTPAQCCLGSQPSSSSPYLPFTHLSWPRRPPISLTPSPSLHHAELIVITVRLLVLMSLNDWLAMMPLNLKASNQPFSHVSCHRLRACYVGITIPYISEIRIYHCTVLKLNNLSTEKSDIQGFEYQLKYQLYRFSAIYFRKIQIRYGLLAVQW